MQTRTAPDVLEARTERVTQHIREASEATGVPFDYLLAQANQESRLNPDAASTRSSAKGLYQFTAGTWLDVIKKHGAEHGLSAYADAIVKGKDGRWTVADTDLKKEILDLRKDSRTSALMAGEYAADNRKVLEAKLGRKASSHDLYLAHFLGAGGALKILQEVKDGQNTAAAGILPQAAKANPEFFRHGDDGAAKSVNALYQTVQNRFSSSLDKASALARTLTARPSVDLANLRPEARPETEETDADSLATLTAAEAATPATMLDLAGYGSFPAAIAAAPPSPEQPSAFPVALPPPVSSPKGDQVTLRGLLGALDGKG